MYQIPPDALTMEGAAKFLNRNPLTFRCSYKMYGVPHVWIGGQLRFFPSDLQAWQEKNPNTMLRMEDRYPNKHKVAA